MKKRILIVVAVIAVLGVIAFLVTRGEESVIDRLENSIKKEKEPERNPLDVALDFYDAWHAEAQSTSTSPYTSGLLDTAPLSTTLRDRARAEEPKEAGAIDPVLCQVDIPEQIGAKLIFETDDTAQVMVKARRVVAPSFAIAYMQVVDGKWIIENVECSFGDVPPDSEFAFDRSGQLLKGSIPAPYDASMWHLVFNENGQQGVVPLYVDADTMCVSGDGSESVCDVSTWSETETVQVQGGMSETGVLVEKVIR